MAVTPIEYMLCFGMIGCCLTLHFSDSRIPKEFNETLQGLEETLVANGRPRTQPESALTPHRECLIWISMAATGALEMAHNLSTTSAVLALTLQRYPDETSNWDTLEKILAKYLWNDVLARQWKRFWRRGIHRQKRLRR
ncbi:hypothetical protein A1O3_05670 [Capronia epimyces CBS 606.96]|uniref:Uncharacterized protein n=1 Tax=Capronia epimyces CBS 606.96 TaxID=1182542 RepID=W9Y5U0_9EURO|nr:uncharacterized protein A1O3_05670 [Capronia epimyces CBS 606.96]EXJ84995.1 hypothetical protein A1O3_05670 [Capronia epimyces CBS 606.96]